MLMASGRCPAPTACAPSTRPSGIEKNSFRWMGRAPGKYPAWWPGCSDTRSNGCMPTRRNPFSLAPVVATVSPKTPTTAVACTPRNARGCHRGMRINESDWNVFLGHAAATLAKFKVPDAEQAELVKFVQSLKKDIVE
jgi:hypothetical protein